MSCLIHLEEASYKICGDDCCLFLSIFEDCDSYIVPTSISTREGKNYRVIGILPQSYWNDGIAANISFEESSEITCVPLSFIGRCSSIFVLPPKIKRVLGSNPLNFPKIKSIMHDRMFVSTTESLVMMNHFPLEVAYYHSLRKKCFIRETVRFVGDYSFSWNKRISSIIFPASVEYIGNYSFYECRNLKFISFRKNSRLKIIGKDSFYRTAIKSVDIPSNVIEIGDSAFGSCLYLKQITFQDYSRLKRIGFSAFSVSIIESINLPSSVEEIGDYAFDNCRKLKIITFSENSRLKIIGEYSFKLTAVESVNIPSSVEEIRDNAFICCRNMKSLTFHEDSKLKTIGKWAFFYTEIKSVDIPPSVKEKFCF